MVPGIEYDVCLPSQCVPAENQLSQLICIYSLPYLFIYCKDNFLEAAGKCCSKDCFTPYLDCCKKRDWNVNSMHYLLSKG